MKGKWTVAACTIAASIALSVALKADTFGAAPFWPGDGIWLYYDGEDAWEVGIWVYCGYACAEFENLYEIPPSPSSQWVNDPTNHIYWWDYPEFYAQFEHGFNESYYEFTFSGNARAGWDCDDGNRAMLNQEYIDYPGGGIDIYWGVGGYPGYIPGCASWGGGLQYGSPSWNTGDWDWYVDRNSWNQVFFNSIQSYFGAPIHVESAYRNPARNARVGGKQDSRHQWGDAIDTKPNGYGAGCTLGGGIGSGSVWEQLYNATWSAGASYVESYNESCTHVHGDYRNW
jgi:hypothetical protein